MAKKYTSFKNPLTLTFRKLPRQKIVTLLLIGGAILITSLVNTKNNITGQEINLPEARAFTGKSPSFSEVKDYLTDLSQKKGALYTYQTLRSMDLPPNMDFHLLGHIVSHQLYKEKGIHGMSYCTDDFRNACSHAIVVGIFSEKGTEALPLITEACRKAPGGTGAYTMCFHGLGHGILSFYGYRMEDAISICKKSGTTPFPNAEATQCISGTVMEIISGGDHDKAVWEKMHQHYLRENSNPLSLCQSPYMPREAAPMCYVYLTPYLFIAAGGNLADPRPYIEKAFKFCEAIPENERANRDTCFGGFGKEFVVLAQNRDIRRIDQMEERQLKAVYDWCSLTPVKEGTLSCISHSLGSLYWGGENDVSASVKFCLVITDPSQKNHCYSSLIGMVSYYQKDPSLRKSFCELIDKVYEPDCNNRLQIKT